MPAAELDPGEITLLLQAWGAGDRSAYERLFPIVYAQLRALDPRDPDLVENRATLERLLAGCPERQPPA